MIRSELGANMTAIVNRLASEMQSTSFYSDYMADVQTSVATQPFNKDHFASDCFEWISGSSLDTRLRNALYYIMQSNPVILADPNAPKYLLKEPLGYIRKAQLAWERRLVKCVNSMASELAIPLARKRSDVEREELTEKWTEISSDETDLANIRPVYAPKDFLEVLASLRNPNYEENTEEHLWGVIKLPLKAKDIKALAEQYGELATCLKHTGIDEQLPGEFRTQLTLSNERLIIGSKVVEKNHGPLSRELSKQGCPASLRAILWHQILGLEITDKHFKYFKELKKSVLQHDLLADRLIMKVLLCFFRDTEVLNHFEYSSASPPLASLRVLSTSSESMVAYPPNGVIPFHGFAMYAAPLCCLYEDPVKLYFTFREFYSRYWHRLHCVNSHVQGAPTIALQFELLFQSSEVRLWQHCCAVGVQLLPIVFRWLVRAFSGYLPPDQLLHLWDVILAWDSLEVLPVLALAIVSFRRENLMDITCQQAAEAVLADISTVKVIPLLKLAFGTDRGKEREA